MRISVKTLTILGRIACIAYMRPIATEVARSAICVLAHRWALQKRLNRSRCHLGADSCDPGKHVLDEDAHWHHLANTIKRSMREAMRPYVHTVTQERVNTGWAKKLHTELTAIILSNLNRLTSLPHVKFVATLPCTLLLIAYFLALMFCKVVWQYVQGVVGPTMTTLLQIYWRIYQ